MKRLIAIVAALAALSGCATFSHAQRPANLYEAAQQIVSSTGAMVARAAHSAGRYGATFGATGGSEVGSFPNAAPLNGSERILADQNATTVNLTPAQIAQYLGIPNGLTFPLSVANGGNGTATPGLVAGSNITITGSWPDQTIASTGGATPGGGSGSIQWNNGGVLAGLSVGAGQILQGGTTPTATSTPTLGASGTLGTLTFGNATSGTETITPPTGALGTLTITLPGSSGTLALTSGNVATATALAATPTTCSATQAATGILANGNATGCFTPAGSGTMTDGAGTTTANELVLSSTTAHAYTNATTLPTSALPALAGDVTSSAGSNSVTVSKVNGAAPPTSALVGGWNSSGQPIAETQGADTTLCNATGSTAAPTACSALTEIGVLSSTAPVNETTSFAPTDRSNAFGEYDMNDASANTFTLNSGLFNTNDTLTIYQKGVGLTSIALGAGVTLTGAGNLGYATLGGQGGYIQIEDTGSDAWRVIAYQPADTTFTVTGGTCATPASTAGGNMGGTITSAATGTVASCTYIITPGGGLTAKNMWVGTMADQTQLAVPAWQQSAQGTTTITFTVPGATAASDVLTFTIHAE